MRNLPTYQLASFYFDFLWCVLIAIRVWLSTPYVRAVRYLQQRDPLQAPGSATHCDPESGLAL